MKEISFRVTPCRETGGFIARWDDAPGKGGITKGDAFAELDAMIADAVNGFFRASRSTTKGSLTLRRGPLCGSGVKLPRDVSAAEAACALRRFG